MANLYADENFPLEVVDYLRSMGHDVITAFSDGRANQGIDDPEVLGRALELGRAIVTLNGCDLSGAPETNGMAT